MVRALASHPRPGSDSRSRHQMFVEFVGWLLSLLREVFLQFLRFSPLLKKQQVCRQREELERKAKERMQTGRSLFVSAV